MLIHEGFSNMCSLGSPSQACISFVSVLFPTSVLYISLFKKIERILVNFRFSWNVITKSQLREKFKAINYNKLLKINHLCWMNWNGASSKRWEDGVALCQLIISCRILSFWCIRVNQIFFQSDALKLRLCMVWVFVLWSVLFSSGQAAMAHKLQCLKAESAELG